MAELSRSSLRACSCMVMLSFLAGILCIRISDDCKRSSIFRRPVSDDECSSRGNRRRTVFWTGEPREMLTCVLFALKSLMVSRRYENSKRLGSLQPLPPESQPWDGALPSPSRSHR
jgi:hypothetical protein